ncbi:MAG: Sec-independent protein translocase subunit TatB [Rubrivivax sp.]|nr:MAG: Sec-independent protein translocase subunit TatB [Rubrivivax sp.]
MIDFGFDKLALIGAVALVVIGPERLPRVARTVGVLLGKAQRYVSQVKSEVNRSIELEELQKMKTGFETAASEVERSVHGGLSDTEAEIQSALSSMDGAHHEGSHPAHYTPSYNHLYTPPRKNWRLKKAALPIWYKQQTGLRRHVQSGAARVARFRPGSYSGPR